MAKNKSINLLPREEFDASLVGRLLKWAVGTFRIIVIVTEMIVMGAFLSRFWLDAQNSDLSESIDIKSAQIENQSDFETSFRQIQKKLAIYKVLIDNPAPSERLALIASKIPQEIILSGISVNDNDLQIKGESGTEIGIAQFISNLQAEKSFKSVDLSSLTSSEENPSVTIFSLGITY